MFKSTRDIATAVKYNIAIQNLLAHVDVLNDRIALKLETIKAGEYFDVWNNGVTIQVRKTEKGAEIGFGADTWLSGLEFSTKLGTKAKPLNKRVLNDIQVWFHRAHHEALEKFKNDLDHHASDFTVRGGIDQIGIIERIMAKPYNVDNISRNSILHDLVNIDATCIRSVFNKVTVTVSVSLRTETKMISNDRQPLLNKLMPVQAGIIKQFVCHYKHEPVNQYAQEVVKQYFQSYE